MPNPSDSRWRQHGGDVRDAATRLATAGVDGAVLRFELQRDALSAKGLTSLQEDELATRAWHALVQGLPADVVGFRSGRLLFEFVLRGGESALVSLGRRLLAALKRDPALAELEYHFVFIQIFAREPERTFRCDPDYDLAQSRGASVIAWVQPYAGDDWRESQRYPDVKLVLRATQTDA